MEGRVIPSKGSAELRLVTDGDAILIDVTGILDEEAVRMIGAATTGTVDCNWRRVRVDLGNVAGFTEGGVVAFAALQSRFPPEAGRRVTYQAQSEAGQDALLAAYARLT
ncbi:MAG: hypothetical protein M3144_10715 [Actinomycetota bacterium]|nr:hypothetical protein [Actinomycetota bacterium]